MDYEMIQKILSRGWFGGGGPGMPMPQQKQMLWGADAARAIQQRPMQWGAERGGQWQGPAQPAAPLPAQPAAPPPPQPAMGFGGTPVDQNRLPQFLRNRLPEW